MFIILKSFNVNGILKQEVVNVSYTNDIISIKKWIIMYLEQEISKLDKLIQNKNERKVSYQIRVNDDYTFDIIKNYKKINPGYIYNTSNKKEEVLYTLKCAEFDTTCIQEIESSNLNDDINIELNNRFLKKMDKESLYQLFLKTQKIFVSNYPKSNYIGIVSDQLLKFKKELYSEIAKINIRKLKKQ